MKQLNKILKPKIILILSISLFFIIYYIFYSKINEGFSVNDIDNMFDDIKVVTKTVKDIPNEINNIDKKFTQEVNNVSNQLEEKTKGMAKDIEVVTRTVNDIPNEINNIDKKFTQEINNVSTKIEKKTEELVKDIEKKLINIFTDKLKSIFTQLGDIFNKGLIKPLLTLFVGISNIFIQIFNILKQIGNKIGSLPNCIITYAMKETIDTFNVIYKKIMPNFVKNIISFVYQYTLKYIFEFIGNISGYNNNVEKCYGFNVSENVDKIQSNLTDISSSFKSDFGRLNFSEIKI